METKKNHLIIDQCHVSVSCVTVFKKQWTKYLEREGIITNRQLGFRTGRSCVTNLLSFYLRVIDITQERDEWADCIYLDFFLKHKRLLWKLEYIDGLIGTL